MNVVNLVINKDDDIHNSEAFVKKTESQKMKDNTVNKKS